MTGGHIRQGRQIGRAGRQAGRQTGNTVRRDKPNTGTTKPPPAFLRSDSCRSGPGAACPAGSSHVPPPPSLKQPSLRQCEGHLLERASTSASTSLAVAQASSSPTSPPQPCYPSCRRRIPAIASFCTAQPPHLKTKPDQGTRITNQTTGHTCPVPGTILTSRLSWRCGAPPPSARQPYLAS